MNPVWISDAVLSFVCFSSALALWKHGSASAKLATISLLLLSLASLFGTLRYAFNLETDGWVFLHNQTSRLFGIAGLYILVLVWLDFGGFLRIQRPWAWAHLADGSLIFLLAYWLDQQATFQLFVGVAMNVTAIVVALRLLKQQQAVLGGGLIVLSVLFIINGLVIGGAQTPLIGPLMRIDVFHLVFAFWAWGIHRVLRTPELTLIGKQLP